MNNNSLAILAINAFPAPREVDRELYISFLKKHSKFAGFPAPREVDRVLYTVSLVGRLAREPLPAPREVNRFYTLAEDKLMEEMSVPFPAPLEADR